MQFTYVKFTNGAVHVVQTVQKAPINAGTTLPSRFVHIGLLTLSGRVQLKCGGTR
jgi:hypothetical protein